MPVRSRPLSPHLQIHRWGVGNTLSILHRATGALLSLALIPLSYWLTALAGGADSYERASRIFSSALGRLVLFGFTFAFFYHLSNGVRHLCWDAGAGFEKSQNRRSGIAAVSAAVLLTLGLWAYVMVGRA